MSPAWADALRVARLFAADPHGCGGVVVRAGAGPVRDRWLDALRALMPSDAPWRRMPGGIGDDRLIGGLDLAATLSAGRPVAQAGLLAEAEGGVIVAPMAERMAQTVAAHLAAALDTGVVRVERDGLAQVRAARFGLVLLDEGVGDDERAPSALTERLAFHLDLTDLALRDTDQPATGRECPHNRTPSIDDEAIASLCGAASALGVLSLRGPLLAVRVARLAAALDGRDAVAEEDIAEAARLVLAPRATRLPQDAAPEQPSDDAEAQEEDSSEDQAEAPPPEPARDSDETSASAVDERIVEAARAAIPAGLLALLGAGGLRLRAPKAGRVGASAASARSGRPVGTRPGDPRQGRLNLIETLRAAAPWQRLRQAESPLPSEGAERRRIFVRAEDFRLTRFRLRTETTTIFAVDASGSAALERLAEAKGAVELLLAEAYTRRDKVALVAFRGARADLILAPTRSLVRAKRGLAGLPGGGGTPLASGIDLAAGVALGVRRGGGAPVVVMLTDGRANVARSGAPGRARAAEDSISAAQTFRAAGLRAILIDTAARPQDSARRLAESMGARYLALPYADAGAMSAAIRSAAE